MRLARLKLHFAVALFTVMMLALAGCGDADSGPDSDTSEGPADSTVVAEPMTTSEVADGAPTAVDTASEAEPTATTLQSADTAQTAVPVATISSEDDPGSEPVGATEEPADDPLPEPENPAPELAAIDAWYNSAPLTLAELRGDPVLLVFWATY